MSTKRIVIIGGGVSGGAVLHYLKKKYANRPDVEILLLEKSEHLGGTAETRFQPEYIFETGPNGFCDDRENTLRYVQELGLESELVRANAASKKRYLSIDRKLHLFPSSLGSFFGFKPLSFWGKLRTLGEVLTPKGGSPEESVFDFGCRRLGKRFTELFWDPMVSGIFAGDAHKLNLQLAFPRLSEIEETHGSLIKWLKARGRQGIGTLTSFNKGMSQLSAGVASKYRDAIRFNQEVRSVESSTDGFKVIFPQGQLEANELFVCVPAYEAARILRPIDRELAASLEKIYYAPIAVVGLLFERAAFNKLPEGFGYLIPSSEGKKVLGVLFESNIFPNRSDEHHFLVRVMVGGVRHSEVAQLSEEEFKKLAMEEIESMFSPVRPPEKILVKLWAKGIPQYDEDYRQAHSVIQRTLAAEKNLHLAANYWGGIALNDCIHNAKLAAEKSSL